LAAAAANAKNAGERHMSIAVSFRAVERNQRVAATVLAGGLAYRLFLWLLPFGLIVGGALGLMDADSTKEAVSNGGLPATISNAIGNASRSTQSDSWWLLIVGVSTLVWSGYSGAKAVQLIHALIWDQPPPRTKPLKGSLAFTGTLCVVFATVAVTWWLRDETWRGLLIAGLTVAPFTALWLWVSLHLPHRDAPWQSLIPGALLMGIGAPVLHGVIVAFLVPKLQKAQALYGVLGSATTLIFFIYLVSLLVVLGAVLNSSLYDELRGRQTGPPPSGSEQSGGEPAG
jgi:membrane protein